MREDSRALGAEGERRAALHLEQRGYRIVGRNVRVGGGEIDLVATRPGLVVFVEVKTRRSHGFGTPEEAVTERKQARLLRAAAAWLHEHRGGLRLARFDVISCEPGPDGGWRLRHLEGAFDADL